MSDRDPLEQAFAEFGQAPSAWIRPPGVDAARHRARGRRRNQLGAVAAVAVLAVALPWPPSTRRGSGPMPATTSPPVTRPTVTPNPPVITTTAKPGPGVLRDATVELDWSWTQVALAVRRRSATGSRPRTASTCRCSRSHRPMWTATAARRRSPRSSATWTSGSGPGGGPAADRPPDVPGARHRAAHLAGRGRSGRRPYGVHRRQRAGEHRGRGLGPAATARRRPPTASGAPSPGTGAAFEQVSGQRTFDPPAASRVSVQVTTWPWARSTSWARDGSPGR